MSTASRLRQSIRDKALSVERPAASKKTPAAYKPAALNVTEFQRTAHAQTARKPHEISAAKGGKIPGIPRHMRKVALAY